MSISDSVFYVCYAVDLAISILTYGFGFNALYTHKVKKHNTFNLWLILGISYKIAISWLNV